MIKQFLKNYYCPDYQKVAYILILTLFAVFGCGDSGGGNGGDTPAGIVDNSDFYGVFESTVQVGSCSAETPTITTGSDQSRHAEDNYIFIPEDSNSIIFTTDDEDVEITVSNNTVSIERTGDEWTFDLVLDFSSDYNTISVSGNATSDDPEDCTGIITGDAVKINRFTDMGNGTVRDNRSNLLWLKEGNAFGPMWCSSALAAANSLESGEHGLTDGSSQGDWRLPTKSEWEEFFDNNYSYPAISNAAGDGRWSQGDAFNFSSNSTAFFWSQTAYDSNMHVAYLDKGRMVLYPCHNHGIWVWPVRTDQ